MTDLWRFRCPEGHTNIETLTDERAHRCNSCRVVYAGEPIDAKMVDEFPVDHDVLQETEDVDPETVLESITEIADDPVRHWVTSREIASDIGVDSRQVGQILSELEAHGHVTRLPRKSCSSWALETDARASADPRAIGLLVLAIGIILTFIAGGVTAL